MGMTSSGIRDDRVLPVTRGLAAVIVPILTVAFVMLWVFPAETGRFFSWPVKPSMSAMMLGATYLGGAWFFGRVVMARSWHTVTLGFLPVTAFAAILGVATVLHWPAFTAGHPSFFLWTVLYVTLPFVLPIVWWRNAAHDPGWAAEDREPVGDVLRLVVGGLGMVLLTTALILVIAPDALIPTWPWTLTPLTARVLGAMFALSGVVGLEIALDRRPGAARAIVQAQAIAVVGILVGLARAGDEVDWSTGTGSLFVAGMVGVLLANGLAAYGVPGRRRRTGATLL
ncbi:MAG: hypothetical protein OEV61_12925 [Chloroflexota bacterium]|jgi:hypothetical protein|nr:hypothetical protein [Chloroflexota bacterium]